MNRNQKIVIVGGIVVFLIIGLFPPWIYTLNTISISSEKQAGYHFIYKPPELPKVWVNSGKTPSSGEIALYNKLAIAFGGGGKYEKLKKGQVEIEDTRYNVKIDIVRLLIQWTMALILTLGLFWVFKKEMAIYEDKVKEEILDNSS